MKRSLIATALLLLSLSGPPALAQSGSTGSIAGTISDPTSAVVPGATITVKNNATSQEFTATSADNGTFNVPALISGNLHCDYCRAGIQNHSPAKRES